MPCEFTNNRAATHEEADLSGLYDSEGAVLSNSPGRGVSAGLNDLRFTRGVQDDL
jgi:hypothetical protein